ncbi:S9 family peptidase [Parvularcula lutaonensis]|uniref:DPP IV N-terminal domain-containing protein n=1 Tax=Parvularcula lutaonensis TaxID=491923 RepID=A0ABV7M7T6_9PROT|nr:S9 family peptidase [Parvularcula lutaonensis]GGY56294.1 peptidase S9 [Parvularcula lutaonensis]
MTRTILRASILAATALLPATSFAEELSLDRLFASPSLTGTSPRAVAYAPDGSLVTFLKAREDDASRLDLWAYDVETGEASMLVDSKLLEPDDFELSEEEKALRERKRISSSKGIVQYQWDSEGEQILVPLAGDLFLVALDDKSVRRLTETEGFEYDAKVSPSGEYVSFLRDGTLYAIDLDSGRERRISPQGEGAVSYGTAEFVAQEEMNRYTGNWWSPDDQRIVYTRTDETGVDIIPRFDIAANDVTVIEQRYPRAGRPNAVVDLFIKDMDKRRPVKVMWGASPDTYLARVDWASPEDLFIQTVNRDQTELTLSKVNLGTGQVEEVYTEKQDAWINLSDDFHPLAEGGFLWTTEETGFRHILHFSEDGEKTQVTLGDWQVRGIAAVDEEAGEVYFVAHVDTPLERHLYRVSYKDPGAPERVTRLGSTWSVSMAPDAGSFVATSSNSSTPPQTGLYDADGERITWIEENALDRMHPYYPYLDAHQTPEFGTLTAETGEALYYSILKPHDFDESKEYPAILRVYGGPGPQLVTNSFGRWFLFDQYMQQQGYVVFTIDGRGSGGRGKGFEDHLYRNMAGVEVTDQLQGTDFLASLPYVDEDRIGVTGWSYGGYMTLHLALRAPEGTFAAAVSGAPVSDWSLYDTFYTERYMDTPQDNPEGYERSSVFPYLGQLETPLLIIHGMADDNVTFDNSTRVFARLQAMGKDFEMMTYPGQRHSIHSGPQGQHRFTHSMRFFDRHLKPGE